MDKNFKLSQTNPEDSHHFKCFRISVHRTFKSKLNPSSKYDRSGRCSNQFPVLCIWCIINSLPLLWAKVFSNVTTTLFQKGREKFPRFQGVLLSRWITSYDKLLIYFAYAAARMGDDLMLGFSDICPTFFLPYFPCHAAIIGHEISPNSIAWDFCFGNHVGFPRISWCKLGFIGCRDISS